MKRMIMSALLVAAFGASFAAPKIAAAGQTVGSGWNSLNVANGFSVVGSNGGTYGAIYEGTTASTATFYTTGTVDGLPTCVVAGLLCADWNYIESPALCEYAASGPQTNTNQLSNSQGGVGYYLVFTGQTWTTGTDTGSCPANYPGAYAGVWIYQW